MIIVNIFRSAFEDTHETLILEEAKTVKEIFPDVDFTGSIISINGYRNTEGQLLKEGDVCTIRLFPKGSASNDMVVGGVLGGIIGMFFGPIGIFVGIAVGVAAAGIASAAVSLYNFIMRRDAAQDMKSPDALENIPQLRGAKNQSNNGKPVPLVFGKHLFTPMYIGSPYTTIEGVDGETQYYHALYLLGYRGLRVTEINLGPVSGIASNSQNTVYDGTLAFDGYSGFATAEPQLDLVQSERESLLYPQAVVQEQLGIELLHPEGDTALELIRHTAKNPMKVQIEFTFNGGLISYDNNGNKRNAVVKISVEWRMAKKHGETPDVWEPFGQIGTGQSGITYSSPVSTITRQKAKVMRFIAERTFDYSEVRDAADRTLELRIYRYDTQANDSRTTDKVYLTNIRTWLFDNEKSKASGYSIAQAPMIEKLRNKTARLGFSIKATDNLNGMLDSLNCILESRCRTWNRNTKTWSDPDWDITTQSWIGDNEIVSNNPASVALKLLQSPAMGRKAYPDSMLDLNSFGEFYEWCEGWRLNKTTENYELTNKRAACNGVLTNKKKIDDVLAVILGTGRAMRILNGNKYGLLIDKPREYPVMILNNQNVLEATNQKAFADPVDGFLIKYIEEADGYQETEVYVMADGSNKPDPNLNQVIETIEIPYVTNYNQIVRDGWYQLACKRLRPEVWNRKLSIDGYLLGIGDRVEVQDDTIVVGMGEGAAITKVVIENGVITEIQTDGEFDITDITKNYGLKIMQFDGIYPGKVRTIPVSIPAVGVYRNFNVSMMIDTPPIPHEGDIVSFGEYNKISTPALCFGKKDNGDGTFDVTLLPYQEGIYSADEGAIPEYIANINSPTGLVPVNEIPPDSVTKDDIINTITGMDTAYKLVPSATVIKRSDDGSREPDVISCEQVKITGTGIQEPADKNIVYSKSDNAVPQPYTAPVQVGDWDWILFSLIGDTANQLYDMVRVQVIGTGAARYLGKTLEQGSATGVAKIKISATETQTVQAHKGDWLAYIGADIDSIWTKGYCVRWNGASWERVPINETALYMQALGDLTSDASAGVFSSILCQQIMAQQATITQLGSSLITLLHPGLLQSENYRAETPTLYGDGFKLTNNGEAELYHCNKFTVRDAGNIALAPKQGK